MINAINQWRRERNRPEAIVEDWQNEYCHLHSLAMMARGYLYHTQEDYLNGWSEIVAETWDEKNWGAIEQRLLQMISSSQDHHPILLNSNRIGYGIVTSRGRVYLTIRGYYE